MTNRFLAAGDETQMHLLAGFETLEEEGAGSLGGSGNVATPLLERVLNAATVAAALVNGRFPDTGPNSGGEPGKGELEPGFFPG